MVSYLINNHKKSIDINQQTIDKMESPIFYALGKIKNNSEKLKMVKLLLSSSDANLSLRNS
jgi:hypothetical protein